MKCLRSKLSSLIINAPIAHIYAITAKVCLCIFSIFVFVYYLFHCGQQSAGRWIWPLGFWLQPWHCEAQLSSSHRFLPSLSPGCHQGCRPGQPPSDMTGERRRENGVLDVCLIKVDKIYLLFDHYTIISLFLNIWRLKQTLINVLIINLKLSWSMFSNVCSICQ